MPEPAPPSCVEDEAVAAPSCGTWQMKLAPEIFRDWEPPGEVWIETSQAPPGQPCSGLALSKFSVPWVCLVFWVFWVFFSLEQAQCTKFCRIFCLQLQTFQKLNLSARLVPDNCCWLLVLPKVPWRLLRSRQLKTQARALPGARQEPHG